MNEQSARWVGRLDAVHARLASLAGAEVAPGALTDPDPPTGERWEAGQVWAHVAEFVPYWLGEAAQLLEHGHDAAPPGFGRTKSDPARVAAIERDRGRDRGLLWERIAGEITGLRAFLAGLDETAWSSRGVHPTLGEMDLDRFVDEFLVGHLEQHANQLDRLVTKRR